jgi:hypothetical protein
MQNAITVCCVELRIERLADWRRARLEALTRATWHGQIRGIGRDVRRERALWYHLCAGWSSLVARRAHNPEVVGSNPTPATSHLIKTKGFRDLTGSLFSFQSPIVHVLCTNQNLLAD